MNFKSISNSVTSNIGSQMLKTKKHSPTLMFGAGVVGVLATVVMASKATLKLEEIVEDTQDTVEQAKTLRGRDRKDYPDDVYRRDMTITYARAVTKIAKLYGPAFLVGCASVGLLTGAHVSLTRRNTAVMAAYATLDRGFKEFERRVTAEVGDEKARELRYGVDSHEVYSETKEGEPVVDVVRHAAAPGDHSGYAKLFGPGNPNYEPTTEHNIFFLKMQQNALNDKLNARGYVLLNDAYDVLGIDRTPAGCVVGWLKRTKGGKDGYIDFGIWGDKDMERFHDFMVGREDYLLLDFNVDGLIYENI